MRPLNHTNQLRTDRFGDSPNALIERKARTFSYESHLLVTGNGPCSKPYQKCDIRHSHRSKKNIVSVFELYAACTEQHNTKTTMTTAMTMIAGTQKWSNMIIKWNKWESKQGRRQRHFVKHYNLYTFSVRFCTTFAHIKTSALNETYTHDYGSDNVFGCPVHI